MSASGVPRVAGQGAGQAPRRTDPRSFLVGGLTGLPSAVVPLAALVFTRDEPMPLAVLLPLALLVVAAMFAVSYVSWRRTTYRIGAADIRVESGILSRTARSVPFERIQDVSLEQALVPRLLGLVEVRFDTGGGKQEEAKLAYLPASEGERLRELVRARRDGGVPATSADASAQLPERVLFAMEPGRIALFGLFRFSLVVVAVVAGAVQQFDWLLPFDPYDLDEWQEVLAGPGAWLAGLGPSAQIVGAVLALASLLLVGFATGMARTVAREWNFTLSRNPKGFRRRRGLFTRTDVVMPVHRVQAVSVGTGVVRHRFGWRDAAFISLGSGTGGSGGGNHVVAPFARLEEIAPIAAEAGFPLPPNDLAWHRVEPAYATVGAIGAALRWAVVVAALATVQAVLAPGWWSDPALLLLPTLLGAARAAAIWLARQRERWALDEELVYRAGGWLAPYLFVASREKLHSAEIATGPVTRRLGYAEVNLGLAGGGLAIPALVPEAAERLRAALLQSMTRRDFSSVS